jgi:hypothetical protein
VLAVAIATSQLRYLERDSAFAISCLRQQLTTVILACAGSYITIPPGYYYGFRCLENTVMVTVRWLSHKGVISSLYSIAMWNKVWEDSARARRELRNQHKFPLHESFAYLLENAIEFYFAEDMRSTWSVIEHPRAQSMQRKDDAPANNKRVARFKGELIELLAGIARWYGTPGESTQRVGALRPREWGRLTNWCKAYMGASTTQKERYKKKGPPLPVIEAPEPHPPSDSDAPTESEDSD